MDRRLLTRASDSMGYFFSNIKRQLINALSQATNTSSDFGQ
jgi:hypothetical protein